MSKGAVTMDVRLESTLARRAEMESQIFTHDDFIDREDCSAYVRYYLPIELPGSWTIYQTSDFFEIGYDADRDCHYAIIPIYDPNWTSV